MIRNRISPALLVLAWLCVTPGVYAMDFGSMLGNVIQNTLTNSTANAVRTVTQASFNRLTDGLTHGVTNTPETKGRAILYRIGNDPTCQSAANYMRANNIPFIERNVESNQTFYDEYTRLGGNGVPYIVFGDRAVSGFNEGMIQEAYAEMRRQSGLPPVPRAVAGSSRGAENAGDMLRPKIDGVAVYQDSDKRSRVIDKLSRNDDCVYMGEERDGFYRVTARSGEGWVDKLLVRR